MLKQLRNCSKGHYFILSIFVFKTLPGTFFPLNCTEQLKTKGSSWPKKHSVDQHILNVHHCSVSQPVRVQTFVISLVPLYSIPANQPYSHSVNQPVWSHISGGCVTQSVRWTDSQTNSHEVFSLTSRYASSWLIRQICQSSSHRLHFTNFNPSSSHCFSSTPLSLSRSWSFPPSLCHWAPVTLPPPQFPVD